MTEVEDVPAVDRREAVGLLAGELERIRLLEELVVRGVLSDWTVTPTLGSGESVNLKLRLRGESTWESSGGVAWRDAAETALIAVPVIAIVVGFHTTTAPCPSRCTAR